MNANTPSILISYGLVESPNFPELDKVIIQSALKTMTNAVGRRNVNLVMRDHPGVTPMMEILTEAFPDKLKVVDENEPLENIMERFSPEAVVFMGGAEDVARDHSDLSKYENTILLPLYGTGGAAEKLANEEGGYKNCPAEVRAAADDVFGNAAIYALSRSLDNTPQAAPGGPAPM
ncbi:MAG: hypothetical protein CMH28_09575 [Micavibrio sp.]|nr:hypothetical protein [Micavibrio sp.]